jgi:L-tartrate/succinate antiporter
MDTSIAAILVVALMVILGMVSWDDVVGYKQAWNVFVWFATLVTMADGLARVKFVDWVTALVAPALKGVSTIYAIVLIAAAFFFIHYFFASGTAHITALFPAFFAVAITIPGISMKTAGLLLAYTVGLTPLMSPYSSGPSPIYYGSGYIKGRDFWVYG